MSAPVISLLFDGEERFKIFDRAAEYVMSPKECSLLLARLIGDPAFFMNWRLDQVQRHRIFLGEYCVDDSRPAADLAAAAIDQEIRRYRTIGRKPIA